MDGATWFSGWAPTGEAARAAQTVQITRTVAFIAAHHVSASRRVGATLEGGRPYDSHIVRGGLAACVTAGFALTGCGHGADQWSRPRFERCVVRDPNAISLLLPRDMTSAQRERLTALTPQVVEVDYLDGQVADVYFADKTHPAHGMAERLRHAATSASEEGVLENAHMAVDVYAFRLGSTAAAMHAIDGCARRASRAD
jgi:hypothetical protein